MNILTKDSLFNILSQIVCNLHFLHNMVHFNHGDLKPANVLVSSKRTIINYQGIKIDSPLSIKIADFGKSSLTYPSNQVNGGVRIFNRSPLVDKYLWFSPFHPDIREGPEGTYYIVDSHIVLSIYANMRHMGVPFYVSFDLYTFFVSFMSIPTVYYSMFTDSDTNGLWSVMFYNDDIPTIRRLIEKNMKSNNVSITIAISILRGIKLKCNCAQIMLNYIRSVYAKNS